MVNYTLTIHLGIKEEERSAVLNRQLALLLLNTLSQLGLILYHHLLDQLLALLLFLHYWVTSFVQQTFTANNGVVRYVPILYLF